MTRTLRGQRLGPLHLPVEEDVESQYLKYIGNTPQGRCVPGLGARASVLDSASLRACLPGLRVSTRLSTDVPGLRICLLLSGVTFVSLLSGVTFAEAVNRFNSNVGYSGLNHAVSAEGLFAENKEKLINVALQALLLKEGDQTSLPNWQLEAQFHALRRLVASKAGFEAFTVLPK